jgi:hypothetical protein
VIRNRFSGYNSEVVSLISFRDLTTACIGLMVGIIIMLALLVNPIAKKAEAEKASGNIRVEIIWPNEINADVDLWCKAPGDVPVGYSNKGGTIFNLVRDDLGFPNDVTNMNYEVMFGRGSPPGEYICNVHLYSNSSKVLPIPVKMVVTYNRMVQGEAETRQTLVADTELTTVGQETTMIRWKMDDNHNLVADSVNSVQHPIRSEGQAH